MQLRNGGRQHFDRGSKQFSTRTWLCKDATPNSWMAVYLYLFLNKRRYKELLLVVVCALTTTRTSKDCSPACHRRLPPDPCSLVFAFSLSLFCFSCCFAFSCWCDRILCVTHRRTDLLFTNEMKSRFPFHSANSNGPVCSSGDSDCHTPHPTTSTSLSCLVRIITMIVEHFHCSIQTPLFAKIEWHYKPACTLAKSYFRTKCWWK